MSHVLWRIAVDAPTWEADDLSGKDAEIAGGRWNARGAPVVYASATASLACLESIVHFNAGGLPMNRYLVEITVPDGVRASGVVDSVPTLPVGWDAEPLGRVSLDHGAAWLKSKRSALMVVPSVIVPEERNILIDPLHPDSPGVTTRKARRWLYDPRVTLPLLSFGWGQERRAGGRDTSSRPRIPPTRARHDASDAPPADSHR